jgi:hypothetical protein
VNKYAVQKKRTDEMRKTEKEKKRIVGVYSLMIVLGTKVSIKTCYRLKTI